MIPPFNIWFRLLLGHGIRNSHIIWLTNHAGRGERRKLNRGKWTITVISHNVYVVAIRLHNIIISGASGAVKTTPVFLTLIKVLRL